MRIIYIAADIILSELNGGARRAISTTQVFAANGHHVVLLANQGKNEAPFEIQNNVLIYRVPCKEPGKMIRNLGGSIHFLISKIRSKNLHHPTSGSIVSDTHYDTYLGDVSPKTLREKIIDFYRHKFPLHKFLRNLPMIPALFRIIKNEKIDIIIERGPSYGVGAIIAGLTGRLYVFDFIDIMYSKWALCQADLVLSYYTTHQIPMYIPRNKIKKVYTTTDADHFKPLPKDLALLTPINLSAKDFICIYVGGMYQWHGLNVMVDAAKLLKLDGILDVKFLLIGDGAVKKDIISMINQNNLNDMFRLPGKIDFNLVPKYLALGDVALTINTGGSIGFKLVEYLACGKAIITTNADIVPILAKNNKEVLYVRINDPQHLKELILYLKNNPNIAKLLGKNARIRVENTFTWQAHYYNIMNGILRMIQTRLKNQKNTNRRKDFE